VAISSSQVRAWSERRSGVGPRLGGPVPLGHQQGWGIVGLGSGPTGWLTKDDQDPACASRGVEPARGGQVGEPAPALEAPVELARRFVANTADRPHSHGCAANDQAGKHNDNDRYSHHVTYSGVDRFKVFVSYNHVK
jgi:hypothetical protein